MSGPNRGRRSLIAGGAMALAAGAGVGIWQALQSQGSDALEALWSVTFETPDGGQLAMAPLRGHRVILNFWATWCPPCVREMPVLERFQREFAARDWRVVGIAADGAAPVREFLARTPVSYSIGLAGFDGVQWSRRLGNAGGGLPFTAFVVPAGDVLRRHVGEMHFDELADWANQLS